MELKKIIIDCDAGTEDAVALLVLIAAHKKKKLVIKGITCLGTGHAHLDNVICDLFTTLDICDALDIPVYRGTTLRTKDSKKVQENSYSGNVRDIFTNKPDTSKLQAEHAVVALHKIVTENPGEILLVCLAPLTNIALAMKLFPDFGNFVKELYVMDGNSTGKENLTSQEKFNFFADPESAHMVLSRFGKPLFFLPWETCLTTNIPSEWRREVLGQIDNSIVEFTNAIESGEYSKSKISSCQPCDGLLAAIVLEPEIINSDSGSLNKKPLRDATATEIVLANKLGTRWPKQSTHSGSSAKENPEAGRSSNKRKRSVSNADDVVSKRLCKNSEFSSDLQDESGQDLSDELLNPCQTDQYNSSLPHALIRLMYQLDLSVLCSLRKLTFERKYPSLSLAFGDNEIDKFNNIVIRHKEKSIHVKIENVDKYYVNNDISYAGLFIKEKTIRKCLINLYFDGFVKYLISEFGSSSNNIEYLIVYTNSGLDLTEEKILKQGQTKQFYPFKFDTVNMEECEILKDFFFTNDNVQGRGFYQFSRDKTMREELLKRLEFSPAMQKAIKERNVPQEFQKQMKEVFLDKLVFAVNQPSREELNSIIRSEIEKNSAVQDNYITLQERISRNLAGPGKHRKLGHSVSRITYEFNLLICLLHDMFLHKNMFSINFEGKGHDISNNIGINYKDRITHVKAYSADGGIGYGQLFPSKHREKYNKFSINKHFTLFVEGLKNNIRYFIIYTNADLNLTEENTLKKGKSPDFHPLKYDSIDIQKKRYKVLRDCSCINGNSLYRFAQDDETTREKVLGLLKLPPSLQKEKKEGRFSDENERELKEKFLGRLVFAVKQPNKEDLNGVIRSEIDKFNVPYNHEDLREIALRWLESHKFVHITKGIMKKLLRDIQNNRSSYQNIQHKNINEEIKFVKNVIKRQGTTAFNELLNFLITGEGIKYLEVLKINGINLSNISAILSSAGNNAVKAFKGLYDLFFDEKGNKTQYLKTLEKEEINLSNVSNILLSTGVNAPRAFQDLYDLWFDEKGNKTRYLKNLEKERINLASVCNILSGARANAPQAFKRLYDLWFDEKGDKTRYLKTLEKERINLASMSGILNKAGSNAAKTFKDLYDLWFDKQENKTRYLKTLEKERINLANVSSILNGTGANALKGFKDLFDLWFDEQGNKTRYLKSLEKERINLANVSSILSGTGANALKGFKDLYDLWFDEQGNKTLYLKTLEKEKINLASISAILGGTRSNAAKAFKDLYDLWFDKQGNKTQYLKTLENEGVNLTNLSTILCGAGANGAKSFKNLYNLWFDKQGNRTQYLRTLKDAGISLNSVSIILHNVGANGAKAFRNLYNLWFDEQGNKTQYLRTLEKEGTSLASISRILYRAGVNGARSFKNLYDLWFDKQGNTTQYLRTLKKEGISLENVINILSKAGAKAPKAFKDLYDLWFDKEGNKTQYLETLKKAEINLTNVSGIFSKTGAKGPKPFKNLYDQWFDKEVSKKRC